MPGMPRFTPLLLLSSVLLAGPAPTGAQVPGEAAEAVPASALISLRSGALDTRRLPPAREALRSGAAREPDAGYRLVKFPGPVSRRQVRALEGAGVRIYAYLPHFAFLVRLPAGRDGALDALGATWWGPYLPRYKIAPAVAAPARQPLAAGEAAVLLLQVYPDADLDRVADRARGLGLEIAGQARGGSFSRLRLFATPEQLARHREDLAEIPEVFWLDAEPRRVALNDTTVWVSQSGVDGGEATPVFDHGLFGEGQVLGVLDSGIDPDMCYFGDPGRGLPPLNLCDGGTAVDPDQRKILAVDFLWQEECRDGIAEHEWDTTGHGTVVAGSAAADDFATPLLHDFADGLAPGARLVIQDAGAGDDPCADFPGIGCPVVDLKPIFRQAYDQGVRIHNNSWGDQEDAPVSNGYSAASQDADQFTWDHPDFLLVFAAGNSGPAAGSVVSPSTAKNVLSVGSTRRGAEAEALSGFSSCGPTDDGRIKPDLTLPGSRIVTAGTDFALGTPDCGTFAVSGTSLSAPAVAGAAALVRQYVTDGWYPTGEPGRHSGFVPSAALLRAALVSSARAMAAAGPIPDACQGWGRVLLDDALYFPPETRRLWVEDRAPAFHSGSSGKARKFHLQAAAGQPLKVTLAWTDFPSTPAANPHLVNDLDLIVEGPAGTFLGNVFAGGSSVAGGGPDRRNTLEQVLLPVPAPGKYTVTVRSFNVPAGPQPFALVVTGEVKAPGLR